MPNPDPSAGARPDTGAGFRHRPASTVAAHADAASGLDPDHPHLFHLARAPTNTYDGGTLQGAHEANWPLLKDQQGACYLARLAPGGVREPHWHPSAWEMNYVIQGRVRWTFVGPNAAEDSFEGGEGDMIFAPQGHFHYLENASATEDLLVLIVFNASAAEPDDDIGIVHALSAMPPDVLAAAFGGSAEQFRALPGKHGRVVIARKEEY